MDASLRDECASRRRRRGTVRGENGMRRPSASTIVAIIAALAAAAPTFAQDGADRGRKKAVRQATLVDDVEAPKQIVEASYRGKRTNPASSSVLVDEPAGVPDSTSVPPGAQEIIIVD